MVLIRNNKPSRVGLPTNGPKKGEAGPTMYFSPGTHEYDEEDLDKIQHQRAAVRCYFEEGPNGKRAVLEEVEGGQADPPTPEKKTAVELKAEIAESEDPDFLRSLLQDDRTTVQAAADRRLAELSANLDPPSGTSTATDPPDPADHLSDDG